MFSPGEYFDEIGLNNVKYFVERLAKSEEGVTAIEYALIAAGIAVAIVVIVGTLGNAISSTFQFVIDKL
jgi:pilus assembly protein Flp/PilA